MFNHWPTRALVAHRAPQLNCYRLAKAIITQGLVVRAASRITEQ